MNGEELLEKYLISVDLGIGQIKELTTLGDSQDELLVVKFPNSKVTNYFSKNNQSKYRIVSDESTIRGAIDIFKTKRPFKDFASIKDKITFYKENLRITDVGEMALYLSQLKEDEELHPQIKKIFEKSLESLIEEIKFVLSIDDAQARDMLGLT